MPEHSNLVSPHKFVSIQLADDDLDDCMFFANALQELSMPTNFPPIHNGEDLLAFLLSAKELPQVLFLDINMPRKNGIQCLEEIKQHERLKEIAVVIISTSLDKAMLKSLHIKGAHFFIRKPNNFSQLKFHIYDSVTLIKQHNFKQPAFENFFIGAQDSI